MSKKMFIDELLNALKISLLAVLSLVTLTTLFNWLINNFGAKDIGTTLILCWPLAIAITVAYKEAR